MREATFVAARDVEMRDILFEQIKFGDAVYWHEVGRIVSWSGYREDVPAGKDDIVYIGCRVGNQFREVIYPADFQVAVMKNCDE